MMKSLSDEINLVGEGDGGVAKTFVLDTNVLLHDPSAIFKFHDNDIVISIFVIEEIDRFKRMQSELGRNARQVSRYLDQLRDNGKLSSGVVLPSGGRLFVDLSRADEPIDGIEPTSNDNKILMLAVSLRKREPQRPVIFVSKDTNVRIKADAFGLIAVDYEDVKLRLDELYTGCREVLVPSDSIDALYSQSEVILSEDLLPNEFVLLRNMERPNSTALGKYHTGRKKVVPVRKYREGVWGLQPRNKEQVFAIDALLDDEIRLVTLVGKAGTGKTLLAIAAGLQRTAEDGAFVRLVVARPIFPLGRDVGYLPGDIEEKLHPWMKPIYDNVEYLLDLRRDGTGGKKGASRGYEELINQGFLEIEPLTYIRGRSIPNQYLIIDEAQNLTPHEIKTIITRAGEGTKVVLTGDPQQIDNPYIDSTNNGLTYLVERFKDQSISGHITLVKGERSELAELAANLL